MYMIRFIQFIEDNIIIIAEIGIVVIVCAATLIALYAINQAVLKYSFCKRYRIEKLPKSIVIKRAKMRDVNEYELQYPYWNHQKRDGTADRRYKGNYIVWPKSYLRVDNIVLSSRKPTAILNTVRSLRQIGVSVKLSPEEVKKRRILEKKKRVLSFDIDLQQIVNMYSEHPTGFEQMCATLFEKMGYTCHVTPKTNDGGYDIYIQKGGETGIVECKCYSKNHKVGRPEIQKLVGANVVVQAKNLLFVTTSDFTPEARLYAGKSDVTLISGQSLIKMLQEYGDTKEDVSVPLEEWQLNQYDLIEYIPEDIYRIYFS